MEKTSILQKVENALETLRPFLHADGGDIQVVALTDDLVLEIKPIGACHECPHIDQTLQNGVYDALRKEVPELKEIKVLS